MSYRRVPSRRAGFGAIPSGLAQATVASTKLALPSSGDPTDGLAAEALEAALTGNGAAFQSTVTKGINTIATVGAAAACAATGAGTVIAPLCGFVAGSVAGSVTKLIFGDGPSCIEAMTTARDGAANALLPRCNNDAMCTREVHTAAQRFAERLYGSCALTDGWSMASTIRAEATRMGLVLGKGENGIFGFASPAWQTYVRERLASEAGAALLGAKQRRWAKESAEAKAVADQEYDTLVKLCPAPPFLRLPGSTTACEKKAAATATQIAAQGYLFAMTDGARGIAATQNAALRSQFAAEVAQDKAIAAQASTLSATQAAQATAARELEAAAILDAASTTRTRNLAGVALLTVAALGGLYVLQRKGAR